MYGGAHSYAVMGLRFSCGTSPAVCGFLKISSTTVHAVSDYRSLCYHCGGHSARSPPLSPACWVLAEFYAFPMSQVYGMIIGSLKLSSTAVNAMSDCHLLGCTCGGHSTHSPSMSAVYWVLADYADLRFSNASVPRNDFLSFLLPRRLLSLLVPGSATPPIG